MGRQLLGPCIAGFLLACMVPVGAMTIVVDYLALPVECGNRLILTRPQRIDNLFAIDARTRRTNWQCALGEDRSVDARPAVADGVAFVWMSATYNGPAKACAVNGRTGKFVWETRTQGAAIGHAMVAGETILYPICPDKSGIGEKRAIQFVDRKTGKFGRMISGNLLGVFGNVAIVSENLEKDLLLYDVPSGKIIFRTKLEDGESGQSHVAYNKKGVAVIGSIDNLLALDIPSRKVLWRRPTDGIAWIPTIDGDKIYLALATSSTQLDGNRTDIQRLEVRDLSSGRRLISKKLKAGFYVNDPAIVLDGTLIVASGHFVIGLAPDSLKEKWRLSTPEIYQMGRVGNTVMVGLEESRVWNLDAATGKKIWTYQSPEIE